MRHKIAGKKLSRSKDQRAALRRIMVKQLFEHERIRTTRAKAEAVRGHAEKLITLAKRGNAAEGAEAVHVRRLAAARLADKEIVTKLFDDIAPRFENRQGGYTRMTKLGIRQGDASEMVILELVEE
ncbi:MAG TPA: 50S ribosomal protein L17 [Chloroflexi bacterium]|nr:50S ribosomal protein L17 [Chloroflexota bacterium]HBY07940.1 50S ribosomal protein L17 [Chloroflexota bacterium]